MPTFSWKKNLTKQPGYSSGVIYTKIQQLMYAFPMNVL